MKIAGFLKTTLLDWDGMVACTVYLQGCNFTCPYCHNRDIVVSDNVTEIPEEQVLDYIKDNSDFLDGVVVSGGEPLMNKDIHKFLGKLKALNVKVKLDTNGSLPDVLDDLIGSELVDMVAMDLKSSLNERYDAAAGCAVDIEKIRKSISVIIDSGIEHEFRTTAVPVYVKEEDIRNICKNIKGAKRYRIHQFRNKFTIDAALSVIDPYPVSRLTAMADIAKEYVKDVKIRGV
ncbi:MAG: anaerobic ribonucleoside-triphosphate reductase activating protein [Methanomassiliicoccaceae archaeon]|nr:anaerobic ribonucleoside-triphosphate reductase activating protein [Methanomassiliicoccaceae archaeon]